MLLETLAKEEVFAAEAEAEAEVVRLRDRREKLRRRVEALRSAVEVLKDNPVESLFGSE